MTGPTLHPQEAASVNPLCEDCPDHEACMTGYPCETVKRVHSQAEATRMGKV